MADIASWYITELPSEIVDIVERDVKKFDDHVDDSLLIGDVKHTEQRDSKNAWIPTSHWVAGWIWYYVQKINRENFRYDLTDIDGGSIQYTVYNEGQYYKSHADTDLASYYRPVDVPSEKTNCRNDQTLLSGEYVRKLSFTLQLTDQREYRGGEVEFFDLEGKPYMAPKQQGTLIVFDSRVKHRVRKVKSGTRKSLVGWCVGPRWK